MAAIHVLETTDATGCSARVVIHVPVPDGPNLAGVSYREALLQRGMGGTTVLSEGDALWQISPAEKRQIERRLQHFGRSEEVN